MCSGLRLRLDLRLRLSLGLQLGLRLKLRLKLRLGLRLRRRLSLSLSLRFRLRLRLWQCLRTWYWLRLRGRVNNLHEGYHRPCNDEQRSHRFREADDTLRLVQG